MTRTQIQLPDELYRRAKQFSAEREMSLAEMTRRGLELLLDRYPRRQQDAREWKMPKVNCGGLKVPLSRVRDYTFRDQETRGLPRRSK